MTDATILVIEGKLADYPSFADGLQKKSFIVESVHSGSQALACIGNVDPDLIVVNAASLRSSGVRICQALREKGDKIPIILILNRGKQPKNSAADVVLTLPFTIQKLVNRIKPLLPGDGNNVIHVGQIRLDVERRRVRCLGKNARLTPRLVNLLKVLLKRPGEVIERKALFKKVWDTEYTGDTRTLDVHISWLRKALEMDPEKPRILKTIRGVGYRLDV
jgi:DNA-binding response OmpR family regulator